ncbi:MAG: hypothetical protein J6A61_02280 [Clostridia bacterium]|nr:hypothetical protein [Clostridia bacterium]
MSEKLAQFVCREFTDRAEKRNQLELKWNLNINFLNGNQYCDADYNQKKIFSIEKLYDYQERAVYNNIAPIIETRIAKLSAVVPQIGAMTNSSDLNDLSNAKISTAVLRSIHKQLNFPEKIAHAVSISEMLGTAFYKIIWQKDHGEFLYRSEKETVKTGEVDTIVCSPYEIYPESLYVEQISEQKSIIHAHPYHVDEIKEKWGVTVEPNRVNLFSMTNITNVTGGLGWTSTAESVSQETKDNFDIVLEYYEKPTKKHPDGRLLIVAYYNEVLLYEGPLPYVNGKYHTRGYPFVKQTAINRPGCFFGISIIERLIPIQRDYNAIQNRINEYLNRAALGIPVIEDGSVDVDSLEYYGMPPGMPIVYGRGSEPPRFMDTPALPYSFLSKQDRLEEAFISISGISELSQFSRAPTNVTSGTALGILAQQDDTRLAVSAENIRNAVLEVARQWLRLYQQFALFERMLKLGGDELDNALIRWNKSNLLPENLELTTQNEIENSLLVKRELIRELYQMGLFTDPKSGRITACAKSKILSLLKMGDWENQMELETLNSTRATRENLKLREGISCSVKARDQHEIHIEEHTKYLLTGEFEELEKTNPAIAELFEAHLKEHEAYL